MSFQDDVARFAEKVERRALAVFARSVTLVKASVVEGSALTGAPGQPEASGDLKGSWQETREREEAHVFTRHPGAPTIEAGTREGRALVLHAGGGGFHSVALTRAGFSRLVAAAVREVAGA